MRDVVIIGGGLSGLAAARELQRLQIPYRLIEVKKRLGGSIVSEQRDGFVLDGGAFAFHREEDWSYLADLGLQDALCPVADSHGRDLVAFASGTQSVVDALAKGLTGTFIHRMAVSSIGTLDGKFTLCLENGLMWEAAALIVAAPARHVERMFRTLTPELSLKLLDYGYDTITRVSIGYKKDDMPASPRFPWDVAIPFYSWTDDPHRVPSGHVLLNVGVRMLPRSIAADAIVQELHREMRAEGKPVLSRVDYWEDADPLPPHLPNFKQKMDSLKQLLPPGVGLVGSDYDGLEFASRIQAGQQAAQQIGSVLAVMSDLHSQYPHLFNETVREPIQMHFELWQNAPQDELISNVNLVPYIGDKWLVIQVDHYYWELPGGTREPDEPHFETLKRELLEEAGVRLKHATPLGAWHCHSKSPRPYRPHLPHPEFYRYVSYGEVEIVGKPLNPSDAEQVTAVELVTLEGAVNRYKSIGRYDFAELYTLAAWARDHQNGHH